MIDRQLTVGDVQAHATTLWAFAASLLDGLAAGKYDKEVAFVESMMLEESIVIPQFSALERALELGLLINKMTAGRGPIIADGKGGYLTQSWIDDPRHKLDRDGNFLE